MTRGEVALVFASMLWCVGGCQGKQSAGPAPQGTAPAKASEPAAGAGDAKAEPRAEAETKAEAKPDTKPDLGERFLDPPWFRKTLFPDATKVEIHRTAADDKGMFSSNLRFILPPGQTPEQCAEYLQERVGTAVKNLTSKRLEDGRFELEGNTERYTVTMQCGAPKGELIAFVSYQWTA